MDIMATKRLLVSIEAVNRTRQELGEVENGIERLRKARLSASRVVLEQQRTQRFLNQAYRAQHQQFMDNISVMRTVGYIGRGLMSMWQAYTIGQMHVSESLGRVEDAQIAVNTALDLYGENSVVYLDAVDNLEKLEAAADKAKGNETAGLIGMGLTAVGVAAQVGTLLAKLELIGAVGAISIPIAFAVTGLFALQQAAEFVSHPTTETAPGGTGAAYPRGFIPGEYLDVSQRMPLPEGVGRGVNVNVTQINYGVPGAEDAGQRMVDLFNSIFNNEDE